MQTTQTEEAPRTSVRSCETCGKSRGKEKNALCLACLERVRKFNRLWKVKNV